MSEPVASRPYMPGYGTLPAGEGRGLLPWSWAEERLVRSHDFWLATVTPQGAPHLMPVWAVWHAGALWFSSSNGSRKARNLGSESRCAVSTDNPLEPVVVQGRVDRVTDPGALAAMLEALNAKYGTGYGLDMVDPASNSVFALRPEWVFALDSSDFNGSPTRFTFAPDGPVPTTEFTRLHDLMSANKPLSVPIRNLGETASFIGQEKGCRGIKTRSATQASAVPGERRQRSR